MSEADVDRAGRWLYMQQRVIADWHRNGPSGGVDELLDRALAGVDALEAVSTLTSVSADLWRAQFTSAAAGDSTTVNATDEMKAAADLLLKELLASVPDDPDWDDPSFEQFEGATELLAAIGAADPAVWDAQRRQRTGQPPADEEFAEVQRLNAGGTQVDLVAVIAGPPDRRKGRRLVAALRFADGMTFLVDKDGATDFDWPDWRLVDDLGTQYMPAGSGGSDSDEHVTFRTAPPPEARWVELAHEGDLEIAFRVSL